MISVGGAKYQLTRDMSKIYMHGFCVGGGGARATPLVMRAKQFDVKDAIRDVNH